VRLAHHLPGSATPRYLLIMQIGRMMSVGSEKILLLYNATTMRLPTFISSYVYRARPFEFDFSYSSAVAFFIPYIGLPVFIPISSALKSPKPVCF
jgi:ABC-type polysaccharide transport system permease subunit